MNSVKFSILVPAYKSSFLSECLESVLTQTYPNFEVIVLNDASPEPIKNLVQKYEDSRIIYYENECNVGAKDIVRNWNKCLSLANGDYIICIGDDDRLKGNCLAEYNRLISIHPGIGLLHGWTEIINEKSEVTNLSSHRCEYESAMSLLWHRTFLYSRQFIGDFCFKTSVLKQIGGFYDLPLAWGSDDITAVLAANVNGVVNTQTPVFQYRINSQTISRSGNAFIKMEAMLQREKWLDDFLKKECQHDQDELYRKELVQKKASYFRRIKTDTIIIDLRNNGRFNIIKWYRNRNKYNMTAKDMIKALLATFS